MQLMDDQKGSGKKSLNFDLNIIPILDILSVLICFLLLTVIWTAVESLDVKQAVGDNSSINSESNIPTIWAQIDNSSNVHFSLRDVGTVAEREFDVPAADGQLAREAIREQLQAIKGHAPELKAGFVMPESGTSYGNIISMIEALRDLEIADVGVVPMAPDKASSTQKGSSAEAGHKSAGAAGATSGQAHFARQVSFARTKTR